MDEPKVRAGKVGRELGGVIRNPLRAGWALRTAARDALRTWAAPRHLYLYTTSAEPSEQTLDRVMAWVRTAQRPDGGNAAYYSLTTGWAGSYAETTGYLLPTVYDYAALGRAPGMEGVAADMLRWLLSVQLPSGAFPGGTAGRETGPSVFNTGQILQGLVRAWRETGDPAVEEAARRAGDWLVGQQRPDGAWTGATYQRRTHTYYTMVAWGMAYLGVETGELRYGASALANARWAMAQRRSDGWFDGINLAGNPIYLHFVAYVLQGLVETGHLLGEDEIVASAEPASWRLLRAFEVRKHMPGALRPDWTADAGPFACLTGNAQMSCTWLRLYERSGDLRWLNAALKNNERVKAAVPRAGRAGVRGGLAGSAPIWGAYQPFRYINWGAKFFADALMMERRALARAGAS